MSFKIVNLFVSPLFGFFVMALFVRRATGFATIVGAIAGLTTVTAISFWTEFTGREISPISFMWAMPLGLLVQIVVGIAATWIPIGKTRESLDAFKQYAPQEVPSSTSLLLDHEKSSDADSP